MEVRGKEMKWEKLRVTVYYREKYEKNWIGFKYLLYYLPYKRDLM